MAVSKKKYAYEGGVRFEVTAYGLLCCPEESKDKKHDCPDCKFCQWCSHSRCSLCLDQDRYEREPDRQS